MPIRPPSPSAPHPPIATALAIAGCGGAGRSAADGSAQDPPSAAAIPAEPADVVRPAADAERRPITKPVVDLEAVPAIGR